MYAFNKSFEKGTSIWWVFGWLNRGALLSLSKLSGTLLTPNGDMLLPEPFSASERREFSLRVFMSYRTEYRGRMGVLTRP